MNKNDLIDAIAADADLSKASAGRALDAAIGAITGALSKGGSVSLVGFGTFSVKARAARQYKRGMWAWRCTMWEKDGSPTRRASILEGRQYDWTLRFF